MAKGNYREYLQADQVKIKKYFYVLRPILACEWIEKTNDMPPIEFDQLVDGLVPEGSELRTVIMQLLARKKAGDELDYEPRINPINEYLEERISYFERAAAGVGTAAGGHDLRLDELFLAALKETGDTR